MTGGGGGDDRRDVTVPVSRRTRQRIGGRRRSHKGKAAAACLPLDVIVEEIAARSDAATLVRCAATCRDARRRIAGDPNLRARLRLRDAGRFLLPLLRGHLAGIRTYEGGRGKATVYQADTAAAIIAESEPLRNTMPVDSRGGLVLVRAAATSRLRVCNPANHRSLDLSSKPAFRLTLPSLLTHSTYVLLVGDADAGGEGGAAAVGRPFRVVQARLELSKTDPLHRRLMVRTFSSEHGAWSPVTAIPAPDIHGSYFCWASPQKVLVAGDVVHWLHLTDGGSYVLMLHVRALRVSVAALPASFPHGDAPGRRSYLLATDSAGGSPVVLVADAEDKNIRVWEQCRRTKTKMRWKARRQAVVEKEAILRFNGEAEEAVRRHNDELVRIFGRTCSMRGLELLSFGERSGVVLLRIRGFILLRLDLHTKKIFRCFSSELERRMSGARVYCPYEADHSSWVPTFGSAAITI